MKFKLALLLSFFYFISFSQEKEVIISFSKTRVSDAFVTIETAYNIKLSYIDKIIQSKVISLERKSRTLNQTLTEISKILNLKFDFINNKYIVVTENKSTLNKEYNHLNEIILTSYLTKGIHKNKNAAYKISPRKIGVLPGLIEADILESIQELPGVTSPDETATGLHVRGGTPDQNEIIWDGINIYHSGHLFGMISPFNANITKNVTFLNKGVSPKYGERIASVIDISTSNEVAENINFGLGINGVSGDAYLEIPIIKNKLSALVSYRKSYEELFETSALENIEHKVFQATDIHSTENSDEAFYFKDYTFKINYQFNANNKFAASYIHIDNDLKHYNENLENKTLFKDVLDTENTGFSLKWFKKWSKNTKQTTTLSASDFSLDYNYLTLKKLLQISDFNKQNRLQNKSISSEITIKKPTGNSSLFGFQSVFKDVNYSFFETTDLKRLLDINQTTLNTYSVYTNFNIRNFSLFDVSFGVRANYYQELKTYRVEPRIIIFKNLTNFLKLQITADIKNQTISQIDETLVSNLSLENKLWRLSDNDNAPIINSKQFSFGILYDFNGWNFDIDTYIKNTDGISALTLGFLSNNPNQFLIGNQKTTGIDFYLKKNFNKVSTWVSYSFIDVKNKFDNINNNEYFTASNEINQAISSSVSYKTKRIQLALGWKWHTGKPYTQSSKNTTDNTLIFDKINTGRLDNYHRVDFSSFYRFRFSKNNKLKGKIGLSIRNLLNQNNQISREYIGENTINEPISTINKYALRRTINFVFRIEW
jgi:hypothetical protein